MKTLIQPQRQLIEKPFPQRIPPYRVITTEQISELLSEIGIGVNSHYEVINVQYKLNKWLGESMIYLWDDRAKYMFEKLGIENRWL